MKLLRKNIKLIAALLTINFLSSLLTPNAAFALTSGPTSPDYTSFEPIDTSDMVNLLSGDLAYNIPLLEVPGPAGGYPLSLSYHAGILPGEEASWVGLGWTLNPGAINRSVNGFADDFRNVEQTDRFYWSGGESHVADLGVTVGISGVVGVTAGLSLGTDTYQGFGIGASTGVQLGIPNTPASVGFNFGVDPWGNPSASGGLQVSAGGQNSAIELSASVGVATNFSSLGGYASGEVSGSYGAPSGAQNGSYLSRRGASLVGGSISASGNGIKPSYTAGGGSSRINNSNQNAISSAGYSFTLPLPLLHLGYTYQRYWIDQTESVSTNGALYFPSVDSENMLTYEHLRDTDYDVYSLQDPAVAVGSRSFENPDMALGGTLPNLDNYQVVAQGITGSIRPHIYQQNLVKRNYRDGNGDDQVVQYPYANNDPHTANVGFRFVNDFSNRLTSGVSTPNPGGPMGHNFPEITSGQDGLSDLVDGVLNGASRNIKHYTNKDINDAKAEMAATGIWPTALLGYIETNSSGFDRQTADEDQVGAFRITNESGVNYHFTLPAFTYDEYSYTENEGRSLTFNEYKNPEKYAYTWHLTGITGPDYVDRGGGISGAEPNRKLDSQDWGYWVEFDYGKWTDQYFWRTPGLDMSDDLDESFSRFSEGTKEIYYLDAIKTKTHTAFFVKDVREDAKSSLKFLRNLKWASNNADDRFVTSSVTDENKAGSFSSMSLQASARIGLLTSEIDYTAHPTSSLRLDRIVLFENTEETVSSVSKSAGIWDYNPVTYNWSHYWEGIDDVAPITFDQHQPDNVLDIRDVSTDFEDRSLRVIDFDNEHYDLVPGTPNSSSGKLTLKSMQLLGKGGTQVVPKMEFSYDVPSSPISTSAAEVNGTSLLLTNQTDLNEGDMLLVNKGSQVGYFVVSSNSLDDFGVIYTSLRPINKVEVSTFNGQITYQKTMNPPYEEDNFDMWGMYKTDFDEELYAYSNFVSREVTDLSSKGLESWSLRSVQTSLGSQINIQYEPDDYKNALVSRSNLMVRDIEVIDELNHRLRLTFYNNFSLDVLSHLVEQSVPMAALIRTSFNRFYSCDGSGFFDDWSWHQFDESVTIKEVGSNYIIVENEDLTTKAGYANRVIVSSVLGLDESTSLISEIGGGLRVKSIEVSNSFTSSMTSYEYSDGFTAYEPIGLGLPFRNLIDDRVNSCVEQKEQDAKDLFSQSYYDIVYGPTNQKLLKTATEIPAPGILYASVKVQEAVSDGESTRQLPSYTVYDFEVFDPAMIGIYDAIDGFQKEFDHGSLDPNFNWSAGVDKFKRASLQLKDYTSRIGNLKSISVFDQDDRLIAETENIYLHNSVAEAAEYEQLLEDRFNNQGVIHEAFLSTRYVRQEGNGPFDLLAVTTKREKYPSVQIGSRSTNYRTGVVTESRNLAFDFYSGQVIETYEQDRYGNKIATKSIPAYHFYNSMKAMNLLSQEGASYVFKMAPDFDPELYSYDHNDALGSLRRDAVGLISADFQSWTQGVDIMEGNTKYLSSPVFRKHKYYRNNFPVNTQEGIPQFNEDGTFYLTIGDGFIPSFEIDDPNLPNSALGWEQQSEVTLYDVNSHALEATDLNGNFAATRFDAANHRVLSTAANARYHGFTASGFENLDEGAIVVSGGGSEETNERSHTGDYSLKLEGTLPEGRAVFSVANAENVGGRTYRVSYWSHETGNPATLFVKVDGGADQSIAVPSNPARTVTIDGDVWELKSADVAVPSTFTTYEVGLKYNGSDVYIDDLRIYPIDGTMTSYVYNEWGELSDILDANNLFTHYEYDGMGRLLSMKRETLKDGPQLVSATDIEYGSFLPTGSLYGRIQPSQMNYNTTTLRIELENEGSGEYETVWTIDGVTNPPEAGLQFNYVAAEAGIKEVFVTVNDTKTSLSYSDFSNVNFAICPQQGEPHSTLCEVDSEGCRTGFVVTYVHDGLCGLEVASKVFDVLTCDNSDCNF